MYEKELNVLLRQGWRSNTVVRYVVRPACERDDSRTSTNTVSVHKGWPSRRR